MPDLVDAASAILTQSARRVEIAAQNIANVTTPGYKRRVAFSQVLGSGEGASVISVVTPIIDNRQGKLVVTGSPFDLALSGPGLFGIRDANGIRFSRQGRFSRDSEGRLVDALGGALQLVSGRDLIVTTSDFKVRAGGMVMQKGIAQGQIAVYASNSESSELLETSYIQQGSYEASNVSNGDEMVAMMEALRRAESGQRVMATYDELMGRVLSTFGGLSQ